MKAGIKSLPHYTYEDYKQWEGDWELIKGIPYAMAPSPLSAHQYVISELIFQIRNQILKNCPDCYVFSELDWIVSEETVLRPDVVVICQRVEDYIKTAPDVIFEVVSRLSSLKDENIKFYIYEAEKVPYYVLIYPEFKKVRVFRLEANKYTKVADCVGESFLFEVRCRFTIDFGRVWY